MSLLGSFRQGIDNGTLKVVFFVVVVLFVFWGVGNQRGPSTQVIAVVNGERITDTRFYKIMRNIDRGQGRDLGEGERNSLARRVLDELIVQELELQKVKELGIEVSDQEVARHIVSIDTFKNEKGVYTKELYERNLARMGTTAAEFENDLREQLQLQRLEEIVLASVNIGEQDIRDWWRLEGTRLDLELVRVPALSFYDDVNPSEAELATWAAENSADVKAWYREHYEARFHKPVRAAARSILLKKGIDASATTALQVRIDALKKEAEAGADFAELARKHSEDASAVTGGDLGTPSPDQMDPKVANAIFGSDPSKAVAGLYIAESDLGFHLIKIESILPEEIIPEKDAESEIALAMMRESRAPGLASSFAEQLRKSWVEQGALDPIMLQTQGLNVSRTESISLADPQVPGLQSLQEVMRALPDARKGQVLDKVFAAEDAWFVVRVAERVEPEDAAFGMDRERIKSRLLRYKQMQFLQEWRDDLMAQATVERRLRLRGETNR